MTHIFAALIALTFSISATAEANETPVDYSSEEIVEWTPPLAAKGPLYTCSMSGTIRGTSIAIIIGGQYIHGPGRISCMHNLNGRIYNYRVTFRLRGLGVGFDLSQIKRMHLVTAGLGVNDPKFFMHSYAIGATAGASLIRAGIEFDAAIRLSRSNGFGFEMGIQGREVLGLGAHLYAMDFRIRPR